MTFSKSLIGITICFPAYCYFQCLLAKLLVHNLLRYIQTSCECRWNLESCFWGRNRCKNQRLLDIFSPLVNRFSLLMQKFEKMMRIDCGSLCWQKRAHEQQKNEGHDLQHLLQFVSPIFLEDLLRLYNVVLNTGDVPCTWNKTMFIILAKFRNAMLPPIFGQ